MRVLRLGGAGQARTGKGSPRFENNSSFCVHITKICERSKKNEGKNVWLLLFSTLLLLPPSTLGGVPIENTMLLLLLPLLLLVLLLVVVVVFHCLHSPPLLRAGTLGRNFWHL